MIPIIGHGTRPSERNPTARNRNEKKFFIRHYTGMIRNSYVKRWLVIAVLASSLTSTSCDQSLASVLSKINAAVAAFQNDKALVEAFVKDLKKTYNPNDPEYIAAQQQYTAARAMQERYLTALRLGPIIGGSSEPDSEISAQLKSAGAEFLHTATKSLSPRSVTSKISFGELIHAPPGLDNSISRLPKAERGRLVDTLTQVRWLRWDDIR